MKLRALSLYWLGRLNGTSAIPKVKAAKTASPNVKVIKVARISIVGPPPQDKDFECPSLSSFRQFCRNDRSYNKNRTCQRKARSGRNGPGDMRVIAQILNNGAAMSVPMWLAQLSGVAREERLSRTGLMLVSQAESMMA